MAQSQETQSQPLLPQVSMKWFFILTVMMAILIFIARAADQGDSLAFAIVFALLFVALFSAFCGFCFTVSFFLGSIEQAVIGDEENISSPFIDGKLPDQIIPPRKTD